MSEGLARVGLCTIRTCFVSCLLSTCAGPLPSAQWSLSFNSVLVSSAWCLIIQCQWLCRQRTQMTRHSESSYT